MPENNKKIINCFHSQTSKVFLKPFHIKSDIEIFLLDILSASKVDVHRSQKLDRSEIGHSQIGHYQKLVEKKEKN